MGRPTTETLLFFVGLFVGCLTAFIFCIRKLCITTAFRRQVKGIPEKNLEMTSAWVKYCRPRVKYGNAAAAIVVYKLNGRDTEARMICEGEHYIELADKVSVLIERSTGRYFAFDVQHIKEAFLMYIVLTVVSCLVAVGTGILAVMCAADYLR